jgi:hypothetical protein
MKSVVLFERRPDLAPLSRREFIGGVAVMGAAGLRLPVWAQATGTAGKATQLLLGVDYYPDQTSEALWEEDARMMADTGFTNVRIAEFAWASILAGCAVRCRHCINITLP